MRVLPDGPSIPDELLQASDQGDVIFLCGAGVSRPAGLPGFVELAQLVIEKLGTPADAASRQLLERILGDAQAAVSLDQVFQNLKYEYGADEIDEVVSGLLDPGTGANIEHHALLLKLSRSAAGRPQIVTTNFDLLFEQADPSLAVTAIVAPNLPDLANGQPLEGIVYLHGRRQIQDDPRKAARLIVSSADFGRAYLAQGWATKFMTDLLRHYTIVLVGYSANDPPSDTCLKVSTRLGMDDLLASTPLTEVRPKRFRPAGATEGCESLRIRTRTPSTPLCGARCGSGRRGRRTSIAGVDQPQT